MNGVKHIGDAADTQKRHAGQPFFGQHQPDERLCAESHQHHQRRDQIHAHLDGAAGHILHLRKIVLCGRHGREQNTVNGTVHIDGNGIRQDPALVVIGKVCRGINAADQQAAQIVIHGIQQRGRQQLPAVGKQSLQPLPREQLSRSPADGKPQNERVNRRIGKLLRHQCPDAKAGISHPQAHNRREYGAAQRREKEQLEDHVPGNIHLLYSLQAGENQHQTNDAHDCRQLCILIKSCNVRCRQKYDRIQHNTCRKVKIKYR